MTASLSVLIIPPNFQESKVIALTQVQLQQFVWAGTFLAVGTRIRPSHVYGWVCTCLEAGTPKGHMTKNT